MIYDNITKTINDFLGGNFVIEYANDYNIDWKKILPEVQDKISYGVVRVDSATTQQVGGQTIRVEQASLKVAIPCEKAIFNEAVALLRSMLNTYPNGLNQLPIADTDETAILYFGAYQDANGTTLNGNDWWIAGVTFIVNIYDGVVDSKDTEIKINGTLLNGIIDSNYTLDKTLDGMVFNGNNIQQNTINGMRKVLTINLVYLKNDALIHDATNHTGILDKEEDLTTTYTISYNNGVITRSLTNMGLVNLNEKNVTGNVMLATWIFSTIKS